MKRSEICNRCEHLERGYCGLRAEELLMDTLMGLYGKHDAELERVESTVFELPKGCPFKLEHTVKYD